jgi:hypothetical protein
MGDTDDADDKKTRSEEDADTGEDDDGPAVVVVGCVVDGVVDDDCTFDNEDV